MRARTLREQLLWLLLPLGIVAIVQFLFTYHAATVTAQQVTDRILLASAHSIAENVGFGDSGLQAEVPPAALGMFDIGYGDSVYYRITTAGGRLLAGDLDLPSPPKTPSPSRAEFYDGRFRGATLRLVAVGQPVLVAGGTQPVSVVVGETLIGRDAMARGLWVSNGAQQFLLVLIVCALAQVALRRVLGPILQLGQEVRERGPDDFAPFAVNALQAEFQPLVEALNAYMQRLKAQIDTQRRFTANAAHQLRTPLALLRTQASYALRNPSETERTEAVLAILSTTQQITRLMNQLLALAKAEPHGAPAPREAIDLVSVTRDILETYGTLAVERGIDLTFETEPATTAVVSADRSGLHDLIVNIVDNAMRYTPAGGRVLVGVAREAGACVLRVEDAGPGIPEAQRELVFERFYRVAGGTGEGSGLGLAIVREIVTAHRGTVELRAGSSGHGLLVEITLPALLGSAVGQNRRPPLQDPVLGPR